MSNKKKKQYDLEKRTAEFGKAIIKFVQGLPDNFVNLPLKSPLVKAGASVGANYMETDGAETKRDFRHKIAICRKEAKETKHWLKMVVEANPSKKESAEPLWQEAHELTSIFSSIINSCDKK
jgi:four helix bundle protein